MKILHLITGLGAGGAEAMLTQLVTRMARPAFDNVVVSLSDKGRWGDEIVAAGIAVQTLGMRPGVPDLAGFIRLIRLLRRERPQVLQTWLYHADLLGLAAGRIAGVPTIAWNLRCAELRLQDHPRSLFWILRLLASLSGIPDAVVVNSEAGRLAHSELGYHPRRWCHIPNGFDTQRFKPAPKARHALRTELGLGGDALLVGMVGRFHPMKDHASFLQAVAFGLPDIVGNAYFVLAGRGVDGCNKVLARQMYALGLSGRVILLGERSDMPQLTAGFDVAVSSSYSEGFSNTLGEAMACGIPCVATDAGDSAVLIGTTGIVVPSGDARALSKAIVRMLMMTDDERRALGDAARQRIIELFSLDAVTRRYEALYLELGAR